jgi:predicted nucleic acid-binding protein
MQQSFAGSQSNFLPKDISGSSPAQALVLDTNVMLDLLVFHDPVCRPLADALERGAWRWLATRPMRDEFDDVLGRPAFERWAGQRKSIATHWARWAAIIEAAPLVPPGPTLRCGDPDDQMFLDLALVLRPSHLLTRDRELLRLAGPASSLGVRVCTPANFGAP